MKFKKVSDHKSTRIIGNWIYTKYVATDGSRSVRHKIMHVLDISNDGYEVCYKINHISSLFEPEYWQRDAVYQMMDNAVMTDSLKDIFDKMVNQYASSNVYTSHMDIKDDIAYIEDRAGVYIISEKDAEYLLEVFKNFNKLPVSKYRLDFLVNSYPDIYSRDKKLTEEDMQFQFVQAGTKLYIVNYGTKVPKIKTYTFDAPFTIQKDKQAKTTYNSFKNTITLDQEFLNYKSAHNEYFLNLKDAEEQVVIHINDSLSYVTRRLRQIEDERTDLTKYEANLRAALAKYESAEK